MGIFKIIRFYVQLYEIITQNTQLRTSNIYTSVLLNFYKTFVDLKIFSQQKMHIYVFFIHFFI